MQIKAIIIQDNEDDNSHPKKESDYSLTFWFHFVINTLCYLSPFLVSWYWIILGIIILQIQYLIFGGCVLTHAEFGGKSKDEPACIGYYFKKWGLIKENTNGTKFFIRYISPLIVLLIAFIWQFVMGLPIVF